jgi:hypothetical protein
MARVLGRVLTAGGVLLATLLPVAAQAGDGERLLPLGKREPGNRYAGCQFVSRAEVVRALSWSGRMGQYNFGEGIVCNIGLGSGMVMIDAFDAGSNSATAARIDARQRLVNPFQVEKRVPNLGREAWKAERKYSNGLLWRQVTVSVRERHFRVRQDTFPTTGRRVATLDQLVKLARAISARLGG